MRVVASFAYDKCWACVLGRKFGIRVRFLSQKASHGVIHEDVELWHEETGRIDEALRYLAHYPHISDCRVFTRSQDGSIARLGITTKRGSCPLYLTVRGFGTDDGRPAMERLDYLGNIHWAFDVKDGKKLEKLRRAMEKRFMIQEILVKRKFERPMSRSVFLLKEAFERGYFDVPKRVSIGGLSKELKIPLSTLNVDIRRALRNVLSDATR